MLDSNYIIKATHRARAFQGAWTGTSGTLAADVIRLLEERQSLMDTINTMTEQNAALRNAVEARLAGGCCDGGKCQPPADAAPERWKAMTQASADRYNADRAKDDDADEIPSDWILQGQRELEAAPDDIRWTGDSILAKQDDIRPGTTSKFGTGAIRSSDVEEFRYDLISPVGLREVARACAEGAAKYGDWNWEKGMPVHDLLNHVLAHIYQFLGGDRSEPHLGHAAWGMLAAIHSHELWPELNARTLRRDGCKAPSDPV